MRINWTPPKAERITDLFAATASRSAFTVSEIGSAFRQVGSLANTAGIPIEKLLAQLGTLRSGGLRPEQVGTALRNIIAILSEKPTPAIEEAFKSLGLTFDDVQKQFRESKDVVGVLRTLKTAGLDTSSALEIFGREASTGALILANQGAAAQALAKDFENVTGTADKMREKMESGLPGAVAQLTSSFEGLMLTLGDAGLTGFLEGAAEALTDFNRWVAAAHPFVQTLLVSALAAGPALLALGAAAKFVSVGLALITPALAVLGTVSLPVLLAIAAAALLLYAAWKPISTFFGGIALSLKGGFFQIGEAVDRLFTALGPLGDGLRWLGEQFSGLFGDATGEGLDFGNAIVDGIIYVIDSITDFINYLKNTSWGDIGADAHQCAD